MEIRDCTSDDVPWLLDEARRVFAPLIDGYEEEGAAAWVAHCVGSDTTITIRGRGIAAFAEIIAFPWAPKRLECDLMHLFGTALDPMEAIGVTCAVRDRAAAMGCRTLYVGSAFQDISVIGKRMRGQPLPPVYRLDMPHV